MSAQAQDPILASAPSPESSRTDHTFWVIAAFAAVLRVIVICLKQVVGTDEALYLVLGRNLISEGRYTLQGEPHLIFPPLFPAVTGLIDRLLGSSEASLVWSSRIAYILFGTALLFPVRSLARRLYGRRAALWAVALVAVWPTLTAYVASWFWGSMSEPVFLFLAIGGLALALRADDKRRLTTHAAAGLAFGLAYLARPEGLGYFVLVACLVGWRVIAPRAEDRRHAALALAAFAAAFLACAAPYVSYLHRHTGHWSPSAKAGTVLQMAFAMLGTDPVHRAATLDTLAYERLGFAVQEGKKGPELGFSEESKGGRAETSVFRVIASNPQLFALHVARNVGSFIGDLLSYQIFPAPLLVLLGAAFFAKPWDARRRRGEAFLAAGILPLGGLLVFGTLPRFLFPAVPVLLIWLAKGALEVESWIGASSLRPRWPQRIWWAVCLIFLATLAGMSLAKPIKARVEKSEPIEYRAAGAWMRASLPAGAVIVCRKPELAFYSWHRMVPLPFADLPAVIAYAKARGASYLVLDHYSCYGARPDLRFLLDASPSEPPPAGLELVHRDASAGEKRPLLIFKIL